MPQALVMIFRCKTSSQNPEDWEPVKIEEVPDFVKTEVSIGRMLDGMVISTPEHPYWYRGERVDPTPGETVQ